MLAQLVIFLVAIFLPALAGAADPYADCIKGYDFGVIPQNNIIVSPINPDCESLCAHECGSFSRKTQLGAELNTVAIVNCASTCQAGQLYSDYYLEEVTSKEGGVTTMLQGPATTKIACSGVLKVQEAAYSSNINVKSGDQVIISILNSSTENKIYLCGRHAVVLDPLMESLRASDWIKNTPPQTVLKSQSDNRCALSMTPAQWQSISNEQLWSPASTQICMWNARNAYFTDTGIWAKDGDELSITWQSSYIYKPVIIGDGNAQDGSPLTTRKNIYTMIHDPNYKGPKNLLQLTLFNQSGLSFLAPGAHLTDPTAGRIDIYGENARVANLGDPYDPSKYDPANRPPGAVWLGLIGKVIDTDYKITPIQSGSDCDSPQQRAQNPQKCSVITDPGHPVYTFGGVLEGFSKTPAVIAPRHIDGGTRDFQDNLGGSKLEIIWGGCAFSDGEMLQYAIASSEPGPLSTEWRDMPKEVFTEDQPLMAHTSGMLYIRIKPMPVPADLAPEHAHYYTDAANRFGQYYIHLTKLTQSSFISDSGGPIKAVVDSVRFTLYGNPKKPHIPGVLQSLYTSLIKESMVIGAIQAVLVLYIAFTGFGYLVGTLQLTQKDLITRLFKFTFVAMIISPTSWNFFSNNFFRLFMDGGLELIGDVVVGSLPASLSDAVDFSKDPTSVFSVFDGPIKILFSRQVWLKIVALLLAGQVSVLIAILVVIAAVTYFIALAKVTVMFLMSIVIISVLLFASPIFFCFMLFGLTKGMFDTWWKFLLSFTLQPVAAFTSFMIFSLLILMALMNSLGFSICPSCFFSLSIPGISDTCLIPAWRMLAFSHFPDDANIAYLPEGVLQNSIIFLILAQGMYFFGEFIVAVVNRIVSGQVINVTSLEDYGGRAQESVLSIVGQDTESIHRRRIEEANRPPKKQTPQNRDSHRRT